MHRSLIQTCLLRWCWAILLSTTPACVRAPLPEPLSEPADLLSSPDAPPLPLPLGTAPSSQPPQTSEPARSGDQFLEDGFKAPGTPPLPELPEEEHPFSPRGLEFGAIPEAQWADRAPGQAPRPLRPASEAGRDVPGLALPSLSRSDPTDSQSAPGSERSTSFPEAGEMPPELWPVPARIAHAWRSFYDASPAAALPQFALLREQAPDRADVQLGLGRCLLARGDLDAAYEGFERARSLAQESEPEPEFFLGLVAYQRGHFREAVGRWTGLIPRLDAMPPTPLHRDHAWLLARARLELGDRAGGEAAFRRALALGGERSDGVLNPPPLELEYLPDGRLPGGAFLPVGQRGNRVLDPPLLVTLEGAIWRLSGTSVLLERVTQPPLGWQDSAPVAVAEGTAPDGTRIPPALIFLSRDPEGRTFLFQQEGELGSALGHGASRQSGGPALSPPRRQPLLPDPVEPIRPALSPDRTLVAFVRLLPVGEEGQREPRLTLLRRSSLDLLPVVWPALPVGEPAFSALGELIFPVQEDQSWHLVRLKPGAPEGEALPDLPLVRVQTSQGVEALSTASSAAFQRLHDPARAPLPARLKPKPPPTPPLKVDEIWGDSDPTALQPIRGEAKTAPEGATRADEDSANSSGSSSAREVPPPVPLAEGDVRSPAASLNPESRQLYFVRSSSARRSVRLYDPGQGHERLISPETLDCHSPAVSASGAQVAFVCRAGSMQQVYLWNQQTEKAERAFGMPLRAGDAAVFEHQ